jgi:hypothetical protein
LSTPLPSGTTLAPGEDELVAGRFMYSTLAFYLYTDLLLTDRRFIASRPNTLLGLIPVGTHRSNFPIENIAGVNAGTRFNIGGLILGVIGLLIGIVALKVPGAEILGVVLIAASGSVIVGAPKQAIQVMNSGGGSFPFPVSFFERDQTMEFAARVSEAIARQGRASRDERAVTPPPPPFPDSDARATLRRLEELRAEGLITNEEYAGKRAEVLSRL